MNKINMTLVIRITPHRIERVIMLLIILFFILSTSYYANQYYDTTTEDKGYIDKLYSGTFFAKIPVDAEIEPVDNNVSTGIVNVTDTTDTNLIEEEPEEEETTIETNTITETNTTTKEEEEEETACTEDDLKWVSFDTEKIDDDSNKEGVIESIKLSYCNLKETESYMIAEIYFWNEYDEDNNIDQLRKTKPHYTTIQTISIFPKEKYTKEHIFPTSKIKSIYTNPKFNYKIEFYYVDEDGDKINTTAVKSISSTYTIK